MREREREGVQREHTEKDLAKSDTGKERKGKREIKRDKGVERLTLKDCRNVHRSRRMV